MTRRTFFTVPVAAAAAAAAGSQPPLCIFSKHLADLNYDQLGKTAKEIGFDGVDLATRPGGHVVPEKVATDLPKAFEAIRSHGVTVPMITTGLLTPDDPAARPTLSTAGRLKIGYFKTGYWKYKSNVELDKILAEVRAGTLGLVDIAKEHGVQLGFHNHSGDYVGSAVWDTRMILEGADPRWAGFYFDPCHATIEGGLYGWTLSTRMVLPRMKMVAIKDFYWKKVGDKWRVEWCPLGEGMVNWSQVFQMFAKARFQGPITLHVEYKTADERAAIAKDFEFLKKQVVAAYK